MVIDNLPDLQQLLRSYEFFTVLDYAEAISKLMVGEPIAFSIDVDTTYDMEYQMKSTLFFRKVKFTNDYIFEHYTSTLHKLEDETFERSHTFFVHPNSFSQLEAYNLLCGRAICKVLSTPDQDHYIAWLQFQFEEKDPYGHYKLIIFKQISYDIGKLLDLLPIEGLDDQCIRADLITSLKKGNRHLVRFKKRQKVEHKFIEACPARKCIVIRPADHNGKLTRPIPS